MLRNRPRLEPDDWVNRDGAGLHVLIVTGPSGVSKTTVGQLVAAAFDLTAHIRMYDFTPFVVNAWVEPWLPDSAHRSHILGGAVAGAALQFAEGG